MGKKCSFSTTHTRAFYKGVLGRLDEEIKGLRSMAQELESAVTRLHCRMGQLEALVDNSVFNDDPISLVAPTIKDIYEIAKNLKTRDNFVEVVDGEK